jgi:hypothetical protein
LTSITIPNSVTSIGDKAFQDCSGLTSVTIGNSVTSIGKSAFSGCTGLTSISIPGSVTSIEKDAFAYCTNLKYITLSSPSIEKYCQSSINDALYDLEFKYQPRKLVIAGKEVTDLVIPEGVTKINGDAFWNCDGLRSVTLPNSLTSIGANAFSACDNLTSIYITKSFPKETLKIFKEYLPKQTKIIRIK